MGIEPAPYTNRTDETFSLTNSNQLPVSQDFLIFFIKISTFPFFFNYNNVRLTNNNCFIRSTLLHQKKKKDILIRASRNSLDRRIEKFEKKKRKEKEKLHYPLIKISALIRALRQSRSRSNNFVANRADIKHRGGSSLAKGLIAVSG